MARHRDLTYPLGTLGSLKMNARKLELRVSSSVLLLGTRLAPGPALLTMPARQSAKTLARVWRLFMDALTTDCVLEERKFHLSEFLYCTGSFLM